MPSYGCLLVSMPQELQARIITGLQSRIRPEDLVELELEPHVTIRYGFADSVRSDDFIPILQDSSPIKLTLLEPDVFIHDGQDVLKLNIYSECLHKLNEAVGSLPLPGETYPEYHPHLTLAYLKPGTAWKYVGDPRLAMLNGTEVVLDQVVYSDANEEKTNLYLTGDPTKSIAGVSLLGNGYIDGRMVRLSFCPGEYRVSSCGAGSEIKILNSNIGGTTGAKLVERDGVKYVAKQYQGNKDQVANELAANKLYELLGSKAGAPKSELALVEGKSALLSEHIPDAKTLASLKGEVREEAYSKLRENFVVDALLANWDVVGTGSDNILIGASGDVHRIDNGGALEYRAQGEPKGSAFGTKVNEIDSMRDKSISPDAAKVFGSLTDDQIRAQVSDLTQRFDYEKVVDTLKQSGYSSLKADALADKLEARVGYLSQRFPASGSSVASTPKPSNAKLQELEKRAAAVKEKAAAERSKAGAVSAATKRERAEANKALADHKAGKTVLTPKEQEPFAKPAPGEFTKTPLDVTHNMNEKEVPHVVDIYAVNGGDSLPKDLTKQFGNDEYDSYRFIYDIAGDTWHVSAGDVNEVNHGDFLQVTEKQTGVPDLLQVRGAYSPSEHSVLFYDMTSQASEIAKFHSEMTNTKLGEEQAIARIEAGLKQAEHNLFRINGKKPKVEVIDIEEMLGAGGGLAAPLDVREAGDNLDLPLGDIAEELDLPEGVSADEVEQAIQDALDHVTSRGMNDENGVAYLESVLEKAGVDAPGQGYLNTLVQTHNDISEAAYERKSTLKNDDIWGYEYELGDSLVHREEHEILEGTILPKDDAFWDEWYPPNGWGCNCSARPITWDEAIDEGYEEDQEEAPEGIGSPPEGFDSDFQELLGDEEDIEAGFGVRLYTKLASPLVVAWLRLAYRRSPLKLAQAYARRLPKQQLDQIRSKVTKTYTKLAPSPSAIETALDYNFYGAPRAAVIALSEMHRVASMSSSRSSVCFSKDIWDACNSIDYGVELGFCPTGPGGGIDPHCGKEEALRFSSSKDADAWGDDRYSSWAKSLDEHEKGYLSSYTGFAYRSVNANLRKGVENDAVKFIDAALEKAPVLDKPVVVYRGVGPESEKVFGVLKSGDVFRDKGYVSTTMSQQVSKQFTEGEASGLPTRMEITVPAGGKGAYMTGGLEYRVGGKSEAEFLLPRGSKFQVNKILVTKSIRIVSAEVCYAC